MSVSLAEALGQVDLETGHVYHCRVRGKLIELRVLDPEPPSSVPDESDVMLDPWVELPQPSNGVRVPVTLGRLADPDIPEIPQDEEST